MILTLILSLILSSRLLWFLCFNGFKTGQQACCCIPLRCLDSTGIGTFGREARHFVDFLAEAGMKYWQVCPLGPTGFGDSPYQCFSAFAGNPYFIDLETLLAKIYSRTRSG